MWLARRARFCIPLLLAFFACLEPPVARSQPAAAQAVASERELLLDVFLNGRPTGQIGEFRQRGTLIYATRKQVLTIGLRPDPRGSTRDDAQLSLAGLVGVTYRLEEATQTIFITAAAAAMQPTVLSMDTGLDYGEHPIESATGAFMNYNVIATHQGSRTVVDGVLDMHAFSPWGVAGTELSAVQGAPGVRPLIRLDSNYSYVVDQSTRRYTAGDLITGGLSWSRPVRLGGMQVSTDFTIRPTLVTFPVPTIAGQVAVPSTIDVLVNGYQMMTRDVPAGPFEVRQLPVITGAGQVTLLTTDTAGQQTSRTLSLYATPAMLAEGLSAFSVEAGAVRMNYGLLSDDYRLPAGSVSYRHGLRDWLTLEAHGEATMGGRTLNGGRIATGGMAGGDAVFTVGAIGAVTLGGAASSFDGQSGMMAAAAFERVAAPVSLGLGAQVATPGFGDVATAYGDTVPLVQTHASVGFSLGSLGSMAVTYVGNRRQGSNRISRDISVLRGAFDIIAPIANVSVSLLSLSYSRPILNERAFLFASAYKDLLHPSQFGVTFGITMPLGRRSSASVNVGSGTSGNYGLVQAGQVATAPGEAGWQLLADSTRPARQLASGQYESDFALMEAGVDRIGAQTAIRASAQGAVALVGRRAFATNTIYDSFAVIDTDQTPGVGVLQENRPVGKSDSRGLLVLPTLRSYDQNKIAIDPADVPMDTDLLAISRVVRPQGHSGVLVHFSIQHNHAALLRLVDGAGQPLPVGSTVRVASATTEQPVGHGGEAYVTGLAPHNALVVTQPDGKQCTASFDFKLIPGTMPVMGPIACVAVQP